MTHLKSLLRNKLLLQKNFNLQEISIDEWPYWMLEENILIANDITEEEEKQKDKDDGKMQSNNFNPSSYMNQMKSMANKFK